MNGQFMSHPLEGTDAEDCSCERCEQYLLTGGLVSYMLFFMEPTDRALRPPGNIYPAS